MLARAMRPAVAWAALIAFLCLTPATTLPTWEWADLLSVDKFVHAVMFGVLTWLLARGLRRRSTNALSDGRLLLVAGAASFFYGASMEVLQQIPGLGRQGDWVDLTANTIGALVGALWLNWRWARKGIAA